MLFLKCRWAMRGLGCALLVLGAGQVLAAPQKASVAWAIPLGGNIGASATMDDEGKHLFTASASNIVYALSTQGV